MYEGVYGPLSREEIKALGNEWQRTRPAIVTVLPHGLRTVALHSGKWTGEEALKRGIPKDAKPVLVYTVATGKTELVYKKKSGAWEAATPPLDFELEWERKRRDRSNETARKLRAERKARDARPLPSATN